MIDNLLSTALTVSTSIGLSVLIGTILNSSVRWAALGILVLVARLLANLASNELPLFLFAVISYGLARALGQGIKSEPSARHSIPDLLFLTALVALAVSDISSLKDGIGAKYAYMVGAMLGGLVFGVLNTRIEKRRLDICIVIAFLGVVAACSIGLSFEERNVDVDYLIRNISPLVVLFSVAFCSSHLAASVASLPCLRKRHEKSHDALRRTKH